MQDRILYEDNHIVIVNKLPGEIVQGDKTGDMPLSETLAEYIGARDGKPGKAFIGVPHRLDRPVEGIVVFAKTSKALSRLCDMFRLGQVTKRYWALLTEEPNVQMALFEDWLIRNEKQNKSFVTKAPQATDKGTNHGSKGAQLAKLKFEYIGRSQRYYLGEIQLLTGRHHQIRCQMASHLSPIKGDLKYGAARSNKDGGICLQAHSVSFIHPVKKEPIEVEAPYPSSWPAVELFENE